MRISMQVIWRNLDGPPKNKELWSRKVAQYITLKSHGFIYCFWPVLPRAQNSPTLVLVTPTLVSGEACLPTMYAFKQNNQTYAKRLVYSELLLQNVCFIMKWVLLIL